MAARKRLPPDVRRQGRLIGSAHGTSQIAVSFLGLLVTRAAGDLHTSEGVVKGAATLALFVAMALTIAQIALRQGMPRKRVTVAGFGMAAIALGVVAAVPSTPVLYVGMVFAGIPLRAVTPLRTAVARSFSGRGVDGTFTGHARAVSYVVRACLTMAVPLIAFTPAGWRAATACLAVWVAGVTVALARAQLPPPTPASARLTGWQLWDLMRERALRWRLFALGTSNFVLQLALLSLEPFLAGAGLGEKAALAVGVMGFLPILSLPVILRFGDLSNDRVWRSGGWAALFLLASGAFALATLTPLPLWAIVLLSVLALAGVELGVGPVNDATRVYASRRAPEADALATLLQSIGYYAGAQAAVVGAWPVVVALWVGVSALTLRFARRTDLQPAGLRLDVDRPLTPVAQIKLGRVTGTAARTRVWVGIGDVKTFGETKEGDRLLLTTPQDSADPDSPRIPVCEVVFRAAWRPREPRRTRGALRPGRTFPCVAEDGKQFGDGRWKAQSGDWVLENGATVLRSPYLDRPLRWELLKHNA